MERLNCITNPLRWGNSLCHKCILLCRKFENCDCLYRFLLHTQFMVRSMLLIFFLVLCVVFLCFVGIRLVYSKLPMSLDCPFLIVPSVFSNIYLPVLLSNAHIALINANVNEKIQRYHHIVSNMTEKKHENHIILLDIECH